jgi:hypothetical protein
VIQSLKLVNVLTLMAHSQCSTEYWEMEVKEELSRGLKWKILPLQIGVIISNTMKSSHHLVRGSLAIPCGAL